MTDGLTYEGLAEMTKADYLKAIKDKALWKKAEAVLLLHKFKLNGTLLPVVALPLRKQKQMKETLRTIKADKSKQKPNLKQVYIAQFELKQDKETGGTLARVHSPLIGKPTKAGGFQKRGKALFQKLNYQLVVEADLQSQQEETTEEQQESSGQPTTSTKPKKKLTPEQETKVREGTQQMLGQLRSIMNKMGIS